MWNRLLTSNETKYRLIRTIIQGVIGVIIANLDVIIGAFSFSPEAKALIVALTMAVLSPIMASLGTTSIPEKDDIPHGYYEETEEEDGESK